MRARPLNVTIIGAGKVGSVLGRVLSEEGVRVVGVISRSRSSARRAARFIGATGASDRLSSIPASTTLVYITTPHAAVASVAQALAGENHLRFPELAVCHASGMLTADVLEPVASRGATVFSFHPLQTFPRDFPPQKILPSARGIYYGVDGSAGAVRIARALARRLRGHVLLVPPELRVLYHAACVVASNHLTTMLAVVEQLGVQLGIRPGRAMEVFGPIVEATVGNIRRTAPAEALSGPIARGGIDTLKEHLEAIHQSAPELLPYFIHVSSETIRLALRKGSIGQRRGEEMQVLLARFEGQSSEREVKR
jgi:predicted short-subunit dehydrogenase-like oxidoreductase (DUF2520 family)